MSNSDGDLILTVYAGTPVQFAADGREVTLSSDFARMYPVSSNAAISPAWQHVVVSDATASITPRNARIYQAGELVSLTMTAVDAEKDLFCELCFTSGAEATALTAPADWRWFGDHISNGAFVPQANTRYRLVILSDGEYVRAAAEGVTL